MIPGAAQWDALGSTARVVVSRPSALGEAQRAVDRELRAIDLACSRFRDDSELSRLNASASGTIGVGPLLFEALCLALRAAELTGGLVDPTIGRALALAGYDRDFASVAPGRRSVRAVPVEGWRALSLDSARRTVRRPPGLRLDLGATAKALAADRAARAAHAVTGAGVLVSLGGDIAVAGDGPPDGWSVRVTDDHRALAGAPGQTVAVRSGGLATSSTTVRRWGPAAHHLIDPRTGRPAQSRWRTVSVAAATCADANIASTAAIVLGAEAPSWLARRNLPSRLVDQAGAVVAVAAWPSELAQAAA